MEQNEDTKIRFIDLVTGTGAFSLAFEKKNLNVFLAMI